MTEPASNHKTAVPAEGREPRVDAFANVDAADVAVSADGVAAAAALPATRGPAADDLACARRAKPLLTVEQQIAHMKSKGITFELCSEEEAAEHLCAKCQFFRVYSYRKLFEKRVGGPRDGQYVNLDFGHLKALSSLDRMLRDVLLPMTLDIEHFAKVRLLAAAEDRGEDGYTVMGEYFASLPESRRDFIEREAGQRRRDPYAGAVVLKYEGDWPLWAFCEVVSFGTFLGVLKFCADRWEDAELLDTHYQYKNSKQVRNAGAHGACILNDIASQDIPARPPAALVNAMTTWGISKRLRVKWLWGRRMIQICSVVYLYATTVLEGSVRSARSRALSELFERVDRSGLPDENPGVAALRFLRCLTDCAGLLD